MYIGMGTNQLVVWLQTNSNGTNQLNFGKKQSRVQNHLMPCSMSWVFNIKCLLSSFTEWVILTTSLLTLWLFLIWVCMRQIKITSSMKFSKKATVVCLLFVFSNLFAVWITSFLSLNLLVIFLPLRTEFPVSGNS